MDNFGSANSITYSRTIARQLGLQEKDIWRLLVGTKITADRFIYDDSPISEDEQRLIFENALSISQDRAYGLHLGRMLTPSSHGTMGFLANCSPCLYTALEDFSEYLPTRVSFGRLGLRCADHSIICLMHASYEDHERINNLVVEAFAVSLINLIENIIGFDLTEGEVRFKFSEPAYIEEFSQFIHCEKILFNQKDNRILIPDKYKDYPNVLSDFNTYKVYKDLCSVQLSRLDSSRKSTTDRVRKKLLLTPPGKPLTEEQVAASMFISKRTLSRRLHEEGTSYREISNDVINSIAKTYLEESEISVENIASLLGYHNNSSFRRAFKKINNISPLAYRKKAKELC